MTTIVNFVIVTRIRKWQWQILRLVGWQVIMETLQSLMFTELETNLVV